MSISKSRSNKGNQIAEVAAVMTMFVPVSVIILTVAIEAIQCYQVYSTLNLVANTAARKLAIAYLSDPTGTQADPSSVLAGVTCGQIVKSSSQYSSPNNTTGWSTATVPPMVTVIVNFKSGQYGCATFPSPDPLNIGTNITWTATATAPLQ